MPRTEYEEAHLCPKCEAAGRLINKRPAKSVAALPGTIIELLECPNDRCPDYMPPQSIGIGTKIPEERFRWSVQVNRDGTIPPKGSGNDGPKAFAMPGIHSSAAQRARDQLAALAMADERGPEGETKELFRDVGL
jgi:hypothetical protein